MRRKVVKRVLRRLMCSVVLTALILPMGPQLGMTKEDNQSCKSLYSSCRHKCISRAKPRASCVGKCQRNYKACIAG